jgi:hypothetical protein
MYGEFEFNVVLFVPTTVVLFNGSILMRSAAKSGKGLVSRAILVHFSSGFLQECYSICVDITSIWYQTPKLSTM